MGITTTGEFKKGVTPVIKDLEIKKHEDFRDSRVIAVKGAIETARLARIELEKTGVTETEGVKIDRIAKEAKDLEAAGKVLKVEDFGIGNAGNPDVNKLVEKLKEVIDHINKCQ